MLVLTRKTNEEIIINKDGVLIRIALCGINGNGTVRIGIVAPDDWAVNRKEIYDQASKHGEVKPLTRKPNPNRKLPN